MSREEDIQTIARRLKACVRRRELPTWAEIEFLADAALSHSTGLSTDGWQPIETAPKDGTEVDLWCRGAGIHGGAISRVPDCWFSDGKWWRHDIEHGDDQCRSRVHNATHWQPLPAPPLPTAEQGGGT